MAMSIISSNKLKFILPLGGLLLLAGIAFAQVVQFGSGTADPCSVYPHSSVPIAMASPAATTALVSLSATKAVYVCGFTVQTGATSTAQLEYGTGAACTSPTALSGTILASTTWVTPSNATQLVTPVGQDLCVVTTGATAAASGWVSYVQN